MQYTDSAMTTDPDDRQPTTPDETEHLRKMTLAEQNKLWDEAKASVREDGA